jgi:hypothetical protein
MKLAAVIVAAAALSGCSSKLESDFKNGCRSTGGSKSFCSCTYDQLKEPLAAAEKNEAVLYTDAFKTAYAKAIVKCKE